MIDVDQIQAQLEESMNDAKAVVRDMDGGGNHYEIIVVSPDFNEKSRIERHRLVHAALGSTLGNEMHAAKIKTLTPDEAESQ